MWSATRTTRTASTRTCTNPKDAASTTKLFLEEGKTDPDEDPIVTLEDGTCMVFDPNSDNALIMDGDSNNANAIWLRNWREIGLDLANETGGWCIQVLVAGGPSEMQRAEESMAKDKGWSSSYTSTRRRLATTATHSMEPYLKALFEAMKTKPKSEERTVTYYPEAVELKGTVKEDEEGNEVFVREKEVCVGDRTPEVYGPR